MEKPIFRMRYAQAAASTREDRFLQQLKSRPRIAVDLMGSDSSPQVLLEAIHEQEFLADLVLLQTKEFIAMDENPIMAVRRKKESSMAIGIQMLKEGKVDAFVSAGNTGALMLTAMIALSPTMERPALLAELPTETGTVATLDVGANLSCKPHHLLQFARFGAQYQKVRHQIGCPKVALLNIGTESEKGTTELRRTYQEILEYAQKNQEEFTFIGNIEGPEVFRGKADVLVTDGFTGNIFLKTAEGVSSFIVSHIEKHFADRIRLGELNTYLHYIDYFGAILAGVHGLIIKVHGYSSPLAFISGIRGAIKLTQEQLAEKIKIQ